MTRFVMKSKVKEFADTNVGSDFYNRLDDKVRDLIEEAEERAEKNDRKTVYSRDL